MLRVLIALHGSADAAPVPDLVGALLTGRDVEINLLHVVPIPSAEQAGHAEAAVLEGYLEAETCGATVGPLIEQLRLTHERMAPGDGLVTRLVPRHLIHHTDQSGVIERCGVAQQRHDSIALLAAYARHLRQHGIDMSRATRDSAVGDPAMIIRESARHFGADLVIVDGAGSPEAAVTMNGWGQDLLRIPCPVLIVPAANDAAPSTPAAVPGATVGARVAPMPTAVKDSHYDCR